MLTEEIKRRLQVALTSADAGTAVFERLAGVESVAPIGTTTDVRNDTLANLATDVEARLDTIEAKVDAIIAALSA